MQIARNLFLIRITLNRTCLLGADSVCKTKEERPVTPDGALTYFFRSK